MTAVRVETRECAPGTVVGRLEKLEALKPEAIPGGSAAAADSRHADRPHDRPTGNPAENHGGFGDSHDAAPTKPRREPGSIHLKGER
jgi:hypothetical protein